jgi:hypothetical protein
MFFKITAHPRDHAGYSEPSKSNPQMMLATPMKPIKANAMKLSEDENISAPMRNCTEKNIDKTPEDISRTIRYLRIEVKAAKI